MLVVMRLAIGYWLLAIGRYGRYRMLDIRREAVRWMELTSKVRHGNATQHRSEAGGWRRWWRNYLPSRELARSRRVARSAADFFLALWGKGFGGKVWSDR